jgi:hypothetical protein
MLVPEAVEILGGVVDELEEARERLVSEVNKPPRGKRYTWYTSEVMYMHGMPFLGIFLHSGRSRNNSVVISASVLLNLRLLIRSLETQNTHFTL